MSEDFDFQKSLLNQLSSVISGMTTLNQRVAGTIEHHSRFEGVFVKLSRQNDQLRSDVQALTSTLDQFRSDTGQRFEGLLQRLQALLHRVDELENTIDGNSRHIRDLRIEVTAQHNQVLSAIQDGLQDRIALQDLSDRTAALERRAGL